MLMCTLFEGGCLRKCMFYTLIYMLTIILIPYWESMFITSTMLLSLALSANIWYSLLTNICPPGGHLQCDTNKLLTHVVLV